MSWFWIMIGGILGFAFLIDWRRKRNRNTSQQPINPNQKPGEDANYMMGDNRYTGGGQ